MNVDELDTIPDDIIKMMFARACIDVIKLEVTKKYCDNVRNGRNGSEKARVSQMYPGGTGGIKIQITIARAIYNELKRQHEKRSEEAVDEWD